MVGDPQIWQDEYPHVVRYRDATLHFQTALPRHTRQAIEQLVEQVPAAKRVSAPLPCSASGLFAKREKLDSLKKNGVCSAATRSATGCTIGPSKS